MNTETTENTQHNSKTPLELENKTYRLEEMSDAMKASLANLTTVIGQQCVLIDVVSSSDKADEFADFVKDVKEEIGNMEYQRSVLQLKIGLLDKVIAMCKSNAEIAKAISMFATAVGMFQKN